MPSRAVVRTITRRARWPASHRCTTSRGRGKVGRTAGAGERLRSRGRRARLEPRRPGRSGDRGRTRRDESYILPPGPEGDVLSARAGARGNDRWEPRPWWPPPFLLTPTSTPCRLRGEAGWQPREAVLSGCAANGVHSPPSTSPMRARVWDRVTVPGSRTPTPAARVGGACCPGPRFDSSLAALCMRARGGSGRLCQAPRPDPPLQEPSAPGKEGAERVTSKATR